MLVSLAILSLWVGIGIAFAARTAAPDERRFAWAPMAMILGPLWGPVAFDRRMIAEDELITAREV